MRFRRSWIDFCLFNVMNEGRGKGNWRIKLIDASGISRINLRRMTVRVETPTLEIMIGLEILLVGISVVILLAITVAESDILIETAYRIVKVRIDKMKMQRWKTLRQRRWTTCMSTTPHIFENPTAPRTRPFIFEEGLKENQNSFSLIQGYS